MSRDLLIGLIGDENSEVTAHRAIPRALQIAAHQFNLSITQQWLHTTTVKGILGDRSFDGLWCVPASPYQDTDGALFAINTARTRRIPLLGSCGGFQHMAIEFARNELGYANADNAEISPRAKMPLIAPLSCSMVEVTGDIDLAPNSLIAKHYQSHSTTEKYHCNFGLNSQYSNIFNNTNLHISGVDSNNEPRAIELADHPFYIGVAYQPERSALEELPHPLISAFVAAAAKIRD